MPVRGAARGSLRGPNDRPHPPARASYTRPPRTRRTSWAGPHGDRSFRLHPGTHGTGAGSSGQCRPGPGRGASFGSGGPVAGGVRDGAGASGPRPTGPGSRDREDRGGPRRLHSAARDRAGSGPRDRIGSAGRGCAGSRNAGPPRPDARERTRTGGQIRAGPASRDRSRSRAACRRADQCRPGSGAGRWSGTRHRPAPGDEGAAGPGGGRGGVAG